MCVPISMSLGLWARASVICVRVCTGKASEEDKSPFPATAPQANANAPPAPEAKAPSGGAAVGSGGVGGWGGGGNSLAMARGLARRQVIRLMAEVVHEPACREALLQHETLLLVALLVHVGTLAFERCGLCDSPQALPQAEAVLADAVALWRREDSEAWPEAKACLLQVLVQARLDQVTEAISTHDIWSRLASAQECVSALDTLAYHLFSSGSAQTLPQISQLLAPVVRSSPAPARSTTPAPAPATAEAVAEGRKDENGAGRGEAKAGGVEQASAALVGYAALARVVSEARDTQTLLVAAEVLLPHMVPSSSADQSAAQLLPVRIRTSIIASAHVLCHQHVMRQCGQRLLRLLLAACSHAAKGPGGLASEAAACATSAAMSLELSALVAGARAQQQLEEEQLGYEAAAALPHCLLGLPRHEARVAAKLVCPLLSGWWTSSDETLRCAAAELAAALARLLEEPVQAGAEMDTDGRGGGDGVCGGEQGAAAGVVEGVACGSEVERDACKFLRTLGFEMLRELMLGLGDGHLKVRVACKRSAGVVGQILLGHHSDVVTLLKSSALDERWQTDIPALMHQWLRLLSIHEPEEVMSYQKLVTTGVSARRADAAGVVAHIGGALLRLRTHVAVAPVARALVLLLGHPESGVRCAAAEALQYFLPPSCPPPSDTPHPKARLAPANSSAPTSSKSAATEEEEEEEAIARRLLELGNRAVESGSFDDAAAQYTRGLENGGMSRDTRATLLSNRAAAYGHLQKWELALGDACSCQALEPQWARSYECKGAALQALGRFDEALEAFRTALSLDPTDEEVV